MKKTFNEPLFLQKVNLSGYKSIEEIDIEFEKGLNIIIGKNAAGKTNFLKFLSKNLSFDYNEFTDFSANLFFKNNKEFSIKSSRHTQIDELLKNTNLSSKVTSVLTISKKIIKDKKDKDSSITEKLQESNIVFDSTFLCHGIPKEYLIVDKPFSFKMAKKGHSNELTKVFTDYSNPYFLKCIAIDVFLATLKIDDFDIVQIRNLLNGIFNKIETIKKILKKYSPIEDMRFSENYNIFMEEDKESFTLSNLFLEFKIDGNWLPYSNLSDGTKRIFYIISEISEFETNNVRPSSNRTYYNIAEINRVILIEEPELGIHPHQFHKLMEFLKEESESKQIIMTTHSPQALDTLDENEFNRIIIAYSTNSKDGTKLRHLNEQELIKAKAYIKEDFLSDYWLYSDLEK